MLLTFLQDENFMWARAFKATAQQATNAPTKWALPTRSDAAANALLGEWVRPESPPAVTHVEHHVAMSSDVEDVRLFRVTEEQARTLRRDAFR